MGTFALLVLQRTVNHEDICTSRFAKDRIMYVTGSAMFVCFGIFVCACVTDLLKICLCTERVFKCTAFSYREQCLITPIN